MKMFKPPQIIWGKDGMVLCQFTREDIAPLYALVDRNREHLGRMGNQTSNNNPDYGTVEESILDPIDPDRVRFGIWVRGALVGSIGFFPDLRGRAEVGYWLGEEHCRQGFASGALDALAAWAFGEGRYIELVAFVHADNSASAKVLKRNNFRVTGETENNFKWYSRIVRKEDYRR